MVLNYIMRRFSVRISGGFLLMLQAGLLQLIWPRQTATLEIYLAFSILSVLAVLAAVGFFFLLHTGWLSGMLTQGLSLLVSLIIYAFGSEILSAQLTMLYSIFMVLYLNSYNIRSAFRTGLDHPDAPEENP